MEFGYTLYVFLFLFAHAHGSSEQVKLNTKFGELRGFLSEPFYDDDDGSWKRAEIYLNIPYALPPVDNLRFEVS